MASLKTELNDSTAAELRASTTFGSNASILFLLSSSHWNLDAPADRIGNPSKLDHNTPRYPRRCRIGNMTEARGPA